MPLRLPVATLAILAGAAVLMPAGAQVPGAAAEPVTPDAFAGQVRAFEAAPMDSAARERLRVLAMRAVATARAMPSDAPARRRLLLDALHALTLVEAHAAAIELAGADLAGQELPNYVIPGLATSYMAEGDPDAAIVLLEGAVRRAPDDAGLVVRLAEAKAEAGSADSADAGLADWLARNPDAAPADRRAVLLARARLARWAGDTGRAAAAVDAAGAAFPGDPAVAAERAALLRATARPRAALRASEDSGDAAADTRAAAWNDLGRPDLALAEAPGDASVRTRSDALAAPRGEAWLGWANSRSGAINSPSGNDEWRAGVLAESAWLGSGWRVGAVAAHQSAEFQGRRPQATRIGGRIVRHVTGGEAMLEAGALVDDFLPGGYAIARHGAWVSDAWRVALRAAANDPEGSLQARAAGIGTDAVSAGATWRPTGTWRIDAGAGRGWLDDGNRHDWASIGAETAQWTWAAGRTSLFGAAWFGRRRDEDVPYFSPRRDRSLELGAVHLREWGLTTHRIRPSVAFYAQSGYDDAIIPRLSYALERPVAEGATLSLEAHVGRPVYDGRRETQAGLVATYRWGAR